MHQNRAQQLQRWSIARGGAWMFLMIACQSDPIPSVPHAPESVAELQGEASPRDESGQKAMEMHPQKGNQKVVPNGDAVRVPKIVGRRIDGPPLQAAHLEITNKASDERFILRTIKPKLVESQTLATIKLEVRATAPWKINLDYPVHVRVHGPEGVRVNKQEQSKADAVSIDQKRIVYDVKFISEDPGEVHFSGVMKFAICQEDSCVPVSQPFMFDIIIPEQGPERG